MTSLTAYLMGSILCPSALHLHAEAPEPHQWMPNLPTMRLSVALKVKEDHETKTLQVNKRRLINGKPNRQ